MVEEVSTISGLVSVDTLVVSSYNVPGCVGLVRNIPRGSTIDPNTVLPDESLPLLSRISDHADRVNEVMIFVR